MSWWHTLIVLLLGLVAGGILTFWIISEILLGAWRRKR